MTSSFWEAARLHPERVAVVEPNGELVHAGVLLREVHRLAHALRARGLQPGAVVAFSMKNRAALLEVYLAAMQLGLYVTQINTGLLAAEVAHVLGDSGAALVFCDATTVAVVRAACELAGLSSDACVCVDPGPAPTELERLKLGQPSEPPAERRLGALLLYTSGTTGRPKGVKRPLRAGLPESTLASEYYLGLFGLRPGDGVHLVSAPLHHGAALNWCTDHLHLGHTVVLAAKWTPKGMLEAVQRWRVTAALLVPTHFKRLLALPAAERGAYDLSTLRHVIHTGAPCAIDVKRRMIEWLGPVIWEIYAASEGAATMVTSTEWLARPGTVGKPFSFSQVRVLDDAGVDCAPGQSGRVYIRQAGASFEYHADPAKTLGAKRGAFFTVGDIGYLDEDGYLYLCDRASDVMVSGGVNIYPSEIEDALCTHPAVVDAAVFGIPDDEWGEAIKAVVELSAGVEPTPVLAAQLIEHCRERIAPFKCPRVVRFSDGLPRENGKLRRRILRDAHWAGRERAI